MPAPSVAITVKTCSPLLLVSTSSLIDKLHPDKSKHSARSEAFIFDPYSNSLVSFNLIVGVIVSTTLIVALALVNLLNLYNFSYPQIRYFYFGF